MTVVPAQYRRPILYVEIYILIVTGSRWFVLITLARIMFSLTTTVVQSTVYPIETCDVE